MEITVNSSHAILGTGLYSADQPVVRGAAPRHKRSRLWWGDFPNPAICIVQLLIFSKRVMLSNLLPF